MYMQAENKEKHADNNSIRSYVRILLTVTNLKDMKFPSSRDSVRRRWVGLPFSTYALYTSTYYVESQSVSMNNGTCTYMHIDGDTCEKGKKYIGSILIARQSESR